VAGEITERAIRVGTSMLAVSRTTRQHLAPLKTFIKCKTSEWRGLKYRSANLVFFQEIIVLIFHILKKNLWQSAKNFLFMLSNLLEYVWWKRKNWFYELTLLISFLAKKEYRHDNENKVYNQFVHRNP
jgi:hypothetical protein